MLPSPRTFEFAFISASKFTLKIPLQKPTNTKKPFSMIEIELIHAQNPLKFVMKYVEHRTVNHLSSFSHSFLFSHIIFEIDKEEFFIYSFGRHLEFCGGVEKVVVAFY